MSLAASVACPGSAHHWSDEYTGSLDAERAVCETGEGMPYVIRINYVPRDRVYVCGMGLATIRQDSMGASARVPSICL